LFVTAVLTIIGFSVHDTIVVFDRIRENLRLNPGEALNPVINFSIMQTMTRSVITSLTVVFTLLALFLFGGFSMRNFALALLVGIVSGTYSSIFNASQIVSLWQELDDRIRHRTAATA
ncbi:MAG: protein translocase subunit SecF, partial [Chloroflexota bacterium]